MNRSRFYAFLVLALVAALVLTGCGGTTDKPSPGGGGSVKPAGGLPGGGGSMKPAGGLPGGGGVNPGSSRVSPGESAGVHPGGGQRGGAPFGSGSFGQSSGQHPGGGLGGPGGAGPGGPGFEGFQPPAGLGGGLSGRHGGPGSGGAGGAGGLGSGRGGAGSGGPGGATGSGGPGGASSGGRGILSGRPSNLEGFGGFGLAHGSDEEGPSLPGDWQPGDLPHDDIEWPEPPTLWDDLPDAAELQEQAQNAVEEAAGQASQHVQEAQEAAQAAYDQMWEDYYAAVDYAAQTYYDTVVAAADEVYDLYANALQEAYQAADYVYDNYASYAAYCYYYPWDCYTYAYDAATATYAPVQTTNNYYYYNYSQGETEPEPASAPAPTPQVSSEQVLQPSAEAYEALVIFANDQLGLAVNPLYAGEVTPDILTLLSYLPPEAQQAIAAAPDLSAATYWGLLSGGAALVAVGDCSPEAPCTLSGEMAVDLSSASLGVYGLWVGETAPADADQALSLVQLVYPKLEGIAFEPVEQEGMVGYAFYAVTTGLGLDADGQPLAATKAIYAGVVPKGDVMMVYAAVGVGGYSPLLNPAD